MTPPFRDVPLCYLDPKRCVVTATPTLVSTVLGSCVGVTMHDPVSGVGGMAHAFLPYRREFPEDREAPCKFVDDALEHLLAACARLGASASRLEIKLFGGAEIMDRAASGGAGLRVGERNVLAAREGLAARGLRLLAEDVGGVRGRKVLFLTHTGGVWVKKLG